MPLPSSYYIADNAPLLTGVVLSVIPSDGRYGAEIMRSSDNGGGAPATSAAVSIVQLWPLTLGGSYYVDYLPQDGQKRYYQAAAYDPRGLAAESTFTAWTSGDTALPIPAQYQQTMGGVTVYPFNPIPVQVDGTWSLSGQTATRNVPSSALYLPTTAALVVGTSGTPSNIPKRIRIPVCNCLVRSSTMTWNASAGYLQSLTSDLLQVEVPLLVPNGVTLTEIDFNLWANATMAVAVNGSLYYCPTSDPTSATSLASVTLSTSPLSTWTVGTAALNFTMSSSSVLLCQVNLPLSGASVSRLGYVEFAYTVPRYDVGY